MTNPRRASLAARWSRGGVLAVAVITLLTITPAAAADEPEPDVVTLPDIGVYDRIQTDIAADGDTVHLVLNDRPFQSRMEVYYQRIDLGSDENSPTPQLVGSAFRISDSEVNSASAAIAVTGRNVHIVWVERVDKKNPMLMYRRSDDAGLSWNEPVLLAKGDFLPWGVKPEITAVGGDVHVLYRDSENMQYLRSRTRGATWDVPVVVAQIAAPSTPVVVDTASFIYVAWRERAPETPANKGKQGLVRYSVSGDGATWSEPSEIAPFNVEGWDLTTRPGFAVSKRVIHAAWETDAERVPKPGGGTFYTTDVMYRRSLDGGITWEESVQLSDGLRRYQPVLTVSGDDVQIAAFGRDEHVLHRSTDGGATWLEPVVWSVPNAGGVKAVPSDLGVHLLYSLRLKGQQGVAVSYSHVDLGFDPPLPVRWRHIGVA